MIDFLSGRTAEIIVIGAVTGFGSAIGSTIGSFVVQKLFLKRLEKTLKVKRK